MGGTISAAFHCLERERRSTRRKFFDHYALDGHFENGALGTVLRCRRRQTRERRAVLIWGVNFTDKVFRRLELDSDNCERIYDSHVQCFDNEEKIHKRLNHRNVMRFYESFSDYYCRYWVFELIDGNDFFTGICYKNDPKIRVQMYMKHILRAVEYCHNKKIVLRSLRPDSFMVTHFSGIVKLMDFIDAVDAPRNRWQESHYDGIKVYNPMYSAPEKIRGDGYGQPADVWSCGAIMYNLLSGTHFYRLSNPDQLRQQQFRGRYSFPDMWWNEVPVEGKNLIDRLLYGFSPSMRIKVDEALQHPYFNLKPSESFNRDPLVLNRLRSLCVKTLWPLFGTWRTKTKASVLYQIPDIIENSPAVDGGRQPGTSDPKCHLESTLSGQVTYRMIYSTVDDNVPLLEEADEVVPLHTSRGTPLTATPTQLVDTVHQIDDEINPILDDANADIRATLKS